MTKDSTVVTGVNGFSPLANKSNLILPSREGVIRCTSKTRSMFLFKIGSRNTSLLTLILSATSIA